MASEISTETPAGPTVDLKSTVNLPRTDFPLKGNLTHSEAARLNKWQELDLYELIRVARTGQPQFVLHDGPPYANGKIHLGTVLNKVLKDFCVKSRSMMGFWAPYVPGWDCHGLPIETQVDRELGSKKAGMSTLDIRRAARKHAEKFVALQKEEFIRLGILGEWEQPYLTMDKSYQATIVRAFGKFVERGAIYKGKRPVHWCIYDQTALAEAEVEYEGHTSPSVYVKFPFTDKARLAPELAGLETSILIWTTTPWTLPANLGIAFNPDLEYVAAKIGGEAFILASGLLAQVAEKLGWGTDPEVIGRYKGSQFDGLNARHPFIERPSLLMLGDHVSLDAGTGAVHTAPGHGYDDYILGTRYGLDIYCPVDNRGISRRRWNILPGSRSSRRTLILSTLCVRREYFYWKKSWNIPIRTAGGVTIRSFSVQLRNGLFRWSPQGFAKKRLKLQLKYSGYRPGAPSE